MDEKEEEFALKIHHYLQHKGCVSTFSEFMENVYIPIRKFGMPKSIDLKRIAEIFEAGIEAAKAQEKSPIEIFEEVQSFIEPFNEYLLDRKLEELRKKIPDPVGWLKKAKEMYMTLAGKSEFDLKLEEMRQSHDIDIEKLRWEKEKFMLQQKADKEKWDNINKMFTPVFAMPEIRDAIKKIDATMKMDWFSFVCPSCNAELSVPLPPNAPEEVPIKCPKCGTITPTDTRNLKK